MSLPPEQASERATAFISYAREDEDFVKRLGESLRAQGVEPVGDWMLVAGEKYEERLRKLAMASQAFVFVITPDSLASKACKDELTLAVENKKQVLPVSHRAHGDDDLLDSALRAPQWTFLREDSDYEAGVRKLVKAINTDFELMDIHGRLLLAAEEWKDNGRNRSYLLRKDGLKEAEAWLAKTSAQSGKLPQPTPLQTEFILSGQRARSRGARIAFGVVLGVVVSLAALSVVALAQRSLAVLNAAEAREQARLARENEERAVSNERLANERKELAQRNADEAERQRRKAEDNLKEARRQQALAVSNERKAVRSAEEARRQQMAAEANARRALEQGKRRLMVATLSLNPEGYEFTTFKEELFGPVFGIKPWRFRGGTKDDSLGNLLQKFFAREPQLFVRIFGDGDRALAERLLAYVGSPDRTEIPLARPRPVSSGGSREKEGEDVPAGESGRRVAETPEGNLYLEPWASRFKRAAEEPAFQAIQLEEYTSGYLKYMDELRRFAPQIKTERGLAFMLDLRFQLGPKLPEEIFRDALKEAPNQTEAEILRRVAELSAQRQRQPFLARGVRRRRQRFLDTPLFSDKMLGF